jgi:ketosteroid isomerase-like protein
MTELLTRPVAAEVTQDSVLEFLNDYREAYERGDDSFFSFFTHDASFFTLSSATRIDSREEFKRSFGPAFASGVTRRSQFMAPEVRITGDAALVTCHNRISVDDATTNLRATFLVVRHGSELKIAHMHNSPLPLPVAPVTGIREMEEISILEERVATTTAQVGTPK